MYLLTVYLIQIQTTCTGSTQWDEWGWGNGGIGNEGLGNGGHGNTNKGEWMWIGGVKVNEGGWKAGKQWWEQNQHMAAAALAAATQQLWQQCHPQGPTTQKPAIHILLAKTESPWLSFWFFGPNHSPPSHVTESHSSAISNPMYPTPIWSPLPKNQPTCLC